MASTDKVFATIGMINTLLENFPMGLLSLMKGKVYTSVFDLIIDILYACGVDVKDIISYLLEKIYAITPKMEDLQNQINNIDFTEVEQSEFLAELEDGIKDILMALMAAIFGCSAIPVLDDKFLDYPPNKFDDDDIDLNKWKSNLYPINFEIPIKMIDPMGILEISPTTSEGRVYYEIAGRDVYYKKEESFNTYGTVSLNKNIRISPIIKNIDNKKILYFKTDELLPENIEIKIEYFNNNGNVLLKWDSIIKISTIETNEGLTIMDNGIPTVLFINDIKINNNYFKYDLNNYTSCVLVEDYDEIEGFHNLFSKVKWYNDTNEAKILGAPLENNAYTYSMVEGIPDNHKEAVRKSNIPSVISASDPNLIVVYEGLDPNELYKTNDLNAFIWYTLTKSTRENQTSINHTMWDNRFSVKKLGVTRNEKEWIEWYNSKKKDGDTLSGKTALFKPIIQLKKSPYNLYGLDVSFPSQCYYKPKYNSNKNPNFCFNSSIYRFNKDYLDNIQILRPKLMLTGFLNYVLGATFSTIQSTQFNFTKKIIETKLSKAILNIIEADDMEVEDCYTNFSNEEFETLLEEMLLSRNNATFYGGNDIKTVQHDIKNCLNLIDSFNSSATREESITKITKLVNELTVLPGEEGSINYGVEVNIDKNLLNKLIWAITMPIMQSLFTPQVMLLIVINMSLTGVVKLESFNGNDLGVILNLLMNKILGLTKAIVKFIKDKIIELLINLLYEVLLPLLSKYMILKNKERIECWIRILTAALASLPRFNFTKQKIKTAIDDVSYADIITPENYNNTNNVTTPESASKC